MVIPCLTGNMVFALIRLGYGGDPRAQRAIDWITTYQRFDDAEGTPQRGGPTTAWRCAGVGTPVRWAS